MKNTLSIMFYMSVHLCICVCEAQKKDSFACFCHSSYNQRQKLALEKLLLFSSVWFSNRRQSVGLEMTRFHGQDFKEEGRL